MVTPVHVVTAFLRHAARSAAASQRPRRQLPRLLGGVSGYLEEPDALAQAVREVEEETGIDRADHATGEGGYALGRRRRRRRVGDGSCIPSCSISMSGRLSVSTGSTPRTAGFRLRRLRTCRPCRASRRHCSVRVRVAAAGREDREE